MRNPTNTMQIGTLTIGGNHPIAVQSMLSRPWKDIEGNRQEAKELAEAGCDILRVAIPTSESVGLIPALKKAVSMPIVADIHFDWRLALASIQAGADKIRINPGNIGKEERVKELAEACKVNGVPIRIGVNAGSVEQSILKKYGGPTAEAMAESALYHASLLEQFGFINIALSVKSPNVSDTIEANILLAQKTHYPLHLGITHAGTPHMGLLKSAAGIGGLLAQGIGDTFRVSLTAPPHEEITAAKDILKAIGLTEDITFISCPTCGRAGVDVIDLTHRVEQALAGYQVPITVAIMGCIVNGPGEAQEADLGITGGSNGKWVLFAKGKILATYTDTEIMTALLAQVDKLANERSL